MALTVIAGARPDWAGFESGLAPLRAPDAPASPTGPGSARGAEGGALPRIEPRPRLYDTGGVRTLVVARATQEVSVYDEGGVLLDHFLCATGVHYPVPGTYTVDSRKPSGWSPDDGSRFEFFTIFAHSHRGVSIGFHAIPTDRQGNLIGGLGEPISHGCVRLDEEKALFLYEWAVNGTKVVVYP